MKDITTYKTDPSVRSEPTEDTIIRIDRLLPKCEKLSDAAKLFAEEGNALAQALIHALPGGVLDELTANLLQHKATLLHVRLG